MTESDPWLPAPTSPPPATRDPVTRERRPVARDLPTAIRPPASAASPPSGRHRREWRQLRAAVVGLVIAAGFLIGCLGARLLEHPARPAPGPAAVALRAEPSQALVIWSTWQAARSAAWEHGSVRELSRLYDGRAGAADVALLREYADRGLRVQGLSEQALSMRLTRSTPEVVTMDLVTRLGRAVAQGPDGVVTLPAGQPRRRLVTWRRLDDGRWVVDRVVARMVTQVSASPQR